LDNAFVLLALVVVLGIAFEFVNGFHDAANAIATAVATRVLTPAQAILMAGALNLVGALSGEAVAKTVGAGIVDAKVVTQDIVVAALIGAIVWDLITFVAALPTSSSHALIFSVIGAALSVHGTDVIIFAGLQKTSLGIVYSPTLAFVSGYLVMLTIYWLLRNVSYRFVNRFFGRAQILSSAYMAFSHGGNDGQKTMGIIALAVYAFNGSTGEFHIDTWVKIACAVSIGLGTATGGWRIIRTMGMRITALKPVHGFAAETSAATVIEVATRLGIPISTTHACSRFPAVSCSDT
jgi:PiT family inorganic phosphate transporter